MSAPFHMEGMVVEYADFVEASRRGRIHGPSVMAATQVVRYEYMRVKPHLLSVPVYDLGEFLLELEDNREDGRFGQLIDDAISMLKEERIPLPYDGFAVLVHNYGGSGNPVIYLVSEDDGEHEVGIYSCKRESWQAIGGAIRLTKDNRFSGHLNPECVYDAAAKEHMNKAIKELAHTLHLALAAINSPKCVVEVQKDTQRHEEVNRGRERGKLPPLPSVRTIKWNHHRVEYIGEQTGRTHASPIPHDRASHDRHYKNGRVVRVKSSKVKGGSEAAPQYKVI